MYHPLPPIPDNPHLLRGLEHVIIPDRGRVLDPPSLLAELQTLLDRKVQCVHAYDQHHKLSSLKKLGSITSLSSILELKDRVQDQTDVTILRALISNISDAMSHLGGNEVMGSGSVDGIDEDVNLSSVDFDVCAYTEPQLHQLCMGMIDNLRLVHDLGLDRTKVSSFLTGVQRGYRDVPYHNIFHGVGVMQFAFCFLTRGNCLKYFYPIDALSVLTAAVSHDVDHPGNSNAFEINTRSPLAILYNDRSVLENHHAAFASTLLTQPGNNFGEVFSAEDQTRFRKIFVESILATDMMFHRRFLEDLEAIDHAISRDSEADRMLMSKTIVHCSDLGVTSHPNFEIAKKWATRVCEEFTNQVHREEDLGITHVGPTVTNLSSIEAIAKMHLGFMVNIVRPMWLLVGELVPAMNEHLGFCDRNIIQWEAVAASGTSPTNGGGGAAGGGSSSSSAARLKRKRSPKL